MIPFFTGTALFWVVTLAQRHPIRRRLWRPLGFLLLLGAAATPLTGGPGWLAVFFVGGGLIALAASGNRAFIKIIVFLGVAMTVILIGDHGCWQRGAEIPLVFTCALASGGTLWYDRRYIGECLLEWPIRVMYRIRAVGPGMDKLPRTGPVLVIANHASFLDPCWVMIRLPRDLTPMMYGEYFNKWGVHFYMKHLINAIPSGVGNVRRETPELDEAIRRLDRGEGVLIFPEGWVRRKADEELRRFAQGAWRILRERPATPVVACWIEGGWGSWTSFWNGPPLKGKRFDIRRPIDIYVAAPVVLDAETLADQQRTREQLREMVLDARKHLAACGFATRESPASPP